MRQPVGGDDVKIGSEFTPDVVVASGPDLETLLEWASMENQRRTWLAIDGSDRPENSDVRYRMVSSTQLAIYKTVEGMRPTVLLRKYLHQETIFVRLFPLTLCPTKAETCQIRVPNEQIFNKFPPFLRSNAAPICCRG